REGVLQQSALSPADASCDVVRAATLADAVLELIDLGTEVVGKGVPAAMLEEQDFTPLLRAREDAAAPVDVRARRDALLARLAALRRA
ncbi:MAG: hypothetical protein ACRDOO_17560, partial [Actinomadura sp.]